MKTDTQDELFALLSSMNRSEKRYFKLQSAAADAKMGQSYLALYRAMLSESNRSATSSSKTHVAQRQDRHQLRRQVLRALRSQYAESSQKASLRAGMLEIELLYARGLVHQARKRLLRLQKQAIQAADLPMQLELIDWQKRILLRSSTSLDDVQLEKLHNIERALLNQVAAEKSAGRVFQETLRLSKSYARTVSGERAARMEALLQEAADLQKAEHSSWKTAIYLNTAAGILFILKRDLSSSERHLEQVIAAWEGRDKNITDEIDLWLSGINNFLNVLLMDQQFQRFQIEVQQFHAKRSSFVRHLVLVNTTLYSQELLYHMNSGVLEAALPLIDNIDKLLREDGDRMPASRVIQMSHNVAMLFFLHSEFSKAGRWTRRIEQLQKLGQRIGLQEFSRILSLIVLYERGEWDLLNYRLSSVQRYFRKRGKITLYEKSLLDILHQLAGGIPANEEKVAFERLTEALIEVQKEARRPVGIVEISLWVESHLQGETLKSVFVRKIQEAW